MPSLDDHFQKTFLNELEKKFNETSKQLSKDYLAFAKPFYPSDAPMSKIGELEFFISSRRWEASHIMKGFSSIDDVKNDLKALILKPALITYEAAKNMALFTFKLLEVLAHVVTAMIQLFFKKPDDNRPFLERMNPFKNAPVFEVPQKDLDLARDAAIDAVESLVKLIVYPYIVSVELGVQCSSFIAKCLFSLDDKMEERLNNLKETVQSSIPSFA